MSSVFRCSRRLLHASRGSSATAAAGFAGTGASTRRLVSGNWDAVRGGSSSRRHCLRESASEELVLAPSVVPTRHFQGSLPRLPIPLLSETLLRYVKAVGPFLPPPALAKTTQLAREFEMNDGARLQQELVRTDRANKHTSYISSDWFEARLQVRDPLPLHSHSSLVARPDPYAADMLTRAAYWLFSTLRFYKLYLDNQLEPDVLFVEKDGFWNRDWFLRTVALTPEYLSAPLMTLASQNRAFPLDMSQYDNLFNSTRVPGVLQDEIKAVGFDPHVIVQYRGHQFAVTVADAEANPLPVEQIHARLKAIVDMAVAPPAVDVGIFTSLPRMEWNATRTRLLRHTINQQSLEEVESAMLVLNLDDGTYDAESPPLSSSSDSSASSSSSPRAVRDVCSTSGASSPWHVVQCGNRWWDKSLSVNVNHSGQLTVSYEASWGDGTAVQRYVDDVQRYSALCSSQQLLPQADLVAATEPVRQLRWEITSELAQVAQKAKRRMQSEEERTDFHACVFTGLEKRVVPSSQRSALAQLAVQLAWWRLNRSVVSSCEDVGMGFYRRGRTDGLHQATPEMQAFALAMTTTGSSAVAQRSAREQASLCRRALEEYDTTKQTVRQGGGVDSHLFALRCVAARLYGRIPPLYTDAAYTALTDPALRVNPLHGSSALLRTSLPTTKGYGVGYTVDQDEEAMVWHVAAWKGLKGPEHSAREFADAVFDATQDIYALLSLA